MIPKIIHQVWEGRKEPLPDFYIQLGATWKQYHPEWQYELWNGDRMEALLDSCYPHLAKLYFDLRYDVQRWDFIRYLILYKMGGMYVDFDYECLASFDSYTTGNQCFFAMEPEAHRRMFGKDIYFNNALMLTPPGHPFFAHIIARLQTAPITYTGRKMHDVLQTTGPLMLTSLYETYKDKNTVGIFPAEWVSPLSKTEVKRWIDKTADMNILEKKMDKVIAIHYFLGSWLA